MNKTIRAISAILLASVLALTVISCTGNSNEEEKDTTGKTNEEMTLPKDELF